MTIAIKKSINELYDAIHTLEQKVEENKTAPAAKKSADLFSFAPQQPSQPHPDTKALASRLDGAIAKVEKLLQEG
ncbi:MAG: hypothetical protein AAGB32_03630 [Pseudomonadota bacterium]